MGYWAWGMRHEALSVDFYPYLSVVDFGCNNEKTALDAEGTEG
jgi:hypothetical protein